MLEHKTLTPFARVLQHLDLTQRVAAARCGILAPTMSRMVTGSLPVSRDMAERILDALDPGRVVFNELHLLYPARFRAWQPSGTVPESSVDGTARSPRAVGDTSMPESVAVTR